MPFRGSLVVFLAMLLLAGALPALGAPKADLWPKWLERNDASVERIDHAAWGGFLKKYVDASHPSGINRVRYGKVSPDDRAALADYVGNLQRTKVTALSGAEQKAYWINLYNALTVKLVLEGYPVKSIRDLPKSAWFSFGPWDVKYLLIEGEKLSLNDAEHRILRPIWKDPRMHYALNCASLGCPNLQPEAYTAENTERLLEKGAREYVSHPRGTALADGGLMLSSIYDWFADDFGGRDGVLAHLARYAPPGLAERLRGYEGRIGYEYDWRLNE